MSCGCGQHNVRIAWYCRAPPCWEDRVPRRLSLSLRGHGFAPKVNLLCRSCGCMVSGASTAQLTSPATTHREIVSVPVAVGGCRFVVPHADHLQVCGLALIGRC